LRSYLEKIPKELEEAAFMDGASRLYTLRRVVLPLAVPGLIVVSTATFIGAYAQQFLFAITFNQVREYQPLPAGHDGRGPYRDPARHAHFSIFTEVLSSRSHRRSDQGITPRLQQQEMTK